MYVRVRVGYYFMLIHVHMSTIVALVLLTGPTLPVTPDLLSPTLMSTSVTIRWKVLQVAYTPETFNITYGKNDNTQTYSVNGGMSEGQNNESFLTIINVSYQQEITGLSTATSYWYQIISTNTFGSTATEVANFTTNEAGECSQDYSYCLLLIHSH